MRLNEPSDVTIENKESSISRERPAVFFCSSSFLKLFRKSSSLINPSVGASSPLLHKVVYGIVNKEGRLVAIYLLEIMEAAFVSSACWIQGMYVYKELENRIDDVAYFGMPKDMDKEGMLDGKGTLCNVKERLTGKTNSRCKPMTKTFFLQYQWMPFLIAALAICYYAPYIAFLKVNSDLNMLKDQSKSEKEDKQESSKAIRIAKQFFFDKHKTKWLTARVYLNIFVKILYLLCNVISLLVLDNVLNNEYVEYGIKWIQWSRLENSMAYDYMGMRDFPKPGNILLPPFGYCELYESARDVRTTLANQHKFVCELSQHILYQYCLFVLWMAIFIGIVVTAVELAHSIFNQVIVTFGYRGDSIIEKIRKHHKLKQREVEYLEFLKDRDISLYEEVVNQLKGDIKCDENEDDIEERIPLKSINNNSRMSPVR